MKFNSKTALTEHIKELEKSGYLISSWISEYVGNKTVMLKVYSVNFKAVKKSD